MSVCDGRYTDINVVLENVRWMGERFVIKGGLYGCGGFLG